jgi:glycosyltransferase involved in cell wall biosynthesis
MNWKSLLRGLLDAPARRAHAKKLRGLSRSSSAEPVVSFGRVLEDRALIHGGAVKLLHLRKGFAANEDTFNILYLVSSAQPAFAVDLARACKERRIAFVWNQNGVGYPAWAGADSERHNGPMRELRALADFVVYQSAFCRASAEKFLGPWNGPSETLINPVDLDAFCPPPSPLPARPLRLLAMGTQNYAERVLSTLDCLAVLRKNGVESTLTLAGKLQWARAAEEVARHIEELALGEHVTILPAFSQDEAVRLYQSHHIVLHPKYLDPCPTVAIEALASGLPVVGSASGGMPELVPDGCGKLVPAPLDWNRLITPTGAEMAAAVAEIRPRLEEYSAAARRHAEEAFDARRWVEHHRTIFHALLA